MVIIKKERENNRFLFLLSGYQDSNLGPPAPKAGALTGLRYTPFLLSLSVVVSQMRCKGSDYIFISKLFQIKICFKFVF